MKPIIDSLKQTHKKLVSPPKTKTTKIDKPVKNNESSKNDDK